MREAARVIKGRFDAYARPGPDGRPYLDETRLARSMRGEGVYVAPGQVRHEASFFLAATGADDEECALGFYQYVEFLVDYLPRYDSAGVACLYEETFWDHPPSLQLDILCRWLYLPVAGVLFLILYFSHRAFPYWALTWLPIAVAVGVCVLAHLSTELESRSHRAPARRSSAERRRASKPSAAGADAPRAGAAGDEDCPALPRPSARDAPGQPPRGAAAGGASGPPPEDADDDDDDPGARPASLFEFDDEEHFGEALPGPRAPAAI